MSRLFNGSTDAITTPANAVYNNLSELSWSAWIMPNSQGGYANGAILVKDPSGAYSPTMGWNITPGNTLYGAVNTYGTFPAISISSTPIPFGVWTHVAMTFKLSGDALVHMYINGVESSYASQQSASGMMADDSASGYVFGNDTYGDAWDGDLAEMVEWNVQLTPTEIATLAASTTGAAAIQPAHIVGYWHLCGTASPEPDSSGNGDNGVLTGTTAGPDSPGYNCNPPPPTPASSFKAAIPFSRRMTAAVSVFDCIFIASHHGAQRFAFGNAAIIGPLQLAYAELNSVYRQLIHQDTANNRSDLYAAIATAATIVARLNATLAGITATGDGALVLQRMQSVVASALVSIQSIQSTE